MNIKIAPGFSGSPPYLNLANLQRTNPWHATFARPHIHSSKPRGHFAAHDAEPPTTFPARRAHARNRSAALDLS